MNDTSFQSLANSYLCDVSSKQQLDSIVLQLRGIQDASLVHVPLLVSLFTKTRSLLLKKECVSLSCRLPFYLVEQNRVDDLAMLLTSIAVPSFQLVSSVLGRLETPDAPQLLVLLNQCGELQKACLAFLELPNPVLNRLSPQIDEFFGGFVAVLGTCFPKWADSRLAGYRESVLCILDLMADALREAVLPVNASTLVAKLSGCMLPLSDNKAWNLFYAVFGSLSKQDSSFIQYIIRHLATVSFEPQVRFLIGLLFRNLDGVCSLAVQPSTVLSSLAPHLAVDAVENLLIHYAQRYLLGTPTYSESFLSSLSQFPSCAASVFSSAGFAEWEVVVQSDHLSSLLDCLDPAVGCLFIVRAVSAAPSHLRTVIRKVTSVASPAKRIVYAQAIESKLQFPSGDPPSKASFAASLASQDLLSALSSYVHAQREVCEKNVLESDFPLLKLPFASSDVLSAEERTDLLADVLAVPSSVPILCFILSHLAQVCERGTQSDDVAEFVQRASTVAMNSNAFERFAAAFYQFGSNSANGLDFDALIPESHRDKLVEILQQFS
eukprot:ANDGO_00064.mRNA.1 hypothetical protein